MKKIILGAILLAACGGKHTGGTTVVKNTAPPDAAVAETYGGDEYGDEYGYDEYGDEGYGGDEYGGDYTPPPPQPPDISGKWASACIPGATKGEFRTINFDNTTDKWDLHVASFGDEKCAKRKSDLHFAGGYSLGVEQPNVPGAWAVLFDFVTRELTADDAKTAKALGKLCGIKKLKAGTATDLSAKGCVALGVHPASCTNDYNLAAIQGGKLRLGVRPADNDLCTADKLPTALDTSVDLVYQWTTTGVPDCDALFGAYQKYSACPKVPADALDGIFLGFRQMESQYKTNGIPAAQQQQAADACKQAVDAISAGLTQMGC